MSLTALKLQVPITTPKRIRIEKPEVLAEALNLSSAGIFFKTLLFFSFIFSLSSLVFLFFAS